MDHLWSPWRYCYIQRADEAEECIFCAIARDSDDERNFVLFRGDHNFVLLNLYPYTTGHLMVAPYQHVSTLGDLAEEAAVELMLLTRIAQKHLGAVYRPGGFNIGMNIGSCAGAGVVGHIHMHALPRWTGDANFMSTVGETRVMPEELPETWRRLRAAFEAGR